jgi:hypothetical protein
MGAFQYLRRLVSSVRAKYPDRLGRSLRGQRPVPETIDNHYEREAVTFVHDPAIATFDLSGHR